MKIFYADFMGQPFEELLLKLNTADETFLISIIGLYVLTLGIYVSLYKTDKYTKSLDSSIALINVKSLFKIYIIYSIILYLWSNFIWYFSGLSQLLLVLINFKWGLLLFFVYVSMKQKRFRIQVIALLVIEVILSLNNFFTEFKYYFIFSFIAFFIYSYKKWDLRKLSFSLLFAVLLFNIGMIWSSVKGDYRNYITRGRYVQSSVVSTTDALSYLIDKVSNINSKSYSESIETLINRISYIDYLSIIINRVPNVIPYENGKLTLKLIDQVIKPRLFFPKKETLNDSRDLNTYSGLSVSGSDVATSIGMGYFAYLYIDYGPYIMFIFLFGLGLLIGFVFRTLFLKSPTVYWGYVITVPLLIVGGGFETSLYKVVGGVLIYFISAYLVLKFMVPKLDRLITNKSDH